MDCLREETVPVSGCSCAQSSIASTRQYQFKEGVCWMWGVQSDFDSPFAHSGYVQFLESGEGCTNDSLSSLDWPLLRSDLAAELNQTIIIIIQIIIICYIYIALFWVLKVLYIEGGGGISSTTTNVQHPPGWCDGSHIAPERPPHTGLLVERRQSDEANRCMGISWRPWWSEASGLVWPGCQGYTPTLFRRTSWDF